MTQCKFKGMDQLYFVPYQCKNKATVDGYCTVHKFSLNRTLDLIKRVGELEAERMERADTNASLLAKNIRQQAKYTRLYAAYKSSEQDLTTLITAIDELPRYDIAQNLLEGKAPTPTDSIVKGLWVDADALQAVLEKQEGNSDG